VTQKRCAITAGSAFQQHVAIKCVTVMVFEEAGKTVLQPLVTGPDSQRIRELFENKTLELWLPNGESDPTQFDVNILKYKQQIQPYKKCSIARNVVCLKNHFETIVCCEQCPISTK
jgi:hypothetical protein